MGQALYRKYRSKGFDEVLGQEHITTTLKNALKAGKISHAYLFTGPRGVGKTSIARILAHEVNKLAYDESQYHLDIIEIDAASNRRIDEIRELRERVHTAPAQTAYKVYIIDEVHMLTKEAFNALLKTLEEPPAHVIFILATTEAHKLPDTIVSRTQRFAFKPIDDVAIVKHLRNIAKAEKISIDDGALKLIARHGAGSFRDSISLLDQASSTGQTITRQYIERLLGVVSEEAVISLSDAVSSGDIKSVTAHLEDLIQQSSASQIAKQISEYLQVQLIDGRIDQSQIISALLRDLIEVPASHDPSSALRIALIEATLSSRPARKQSEQKPDEADTRELHVEAIAIETVVPLVVETEHQPTESLEPLELWPRTLAEIKKYHATLYSIARMAHATLGDHEITLVFEFQFHQKRVNEAKNLQIITDVLRKFSGEDYVIHSEIINSPEETKPTTKIKQADPTIATISNIFGDAEVLES